MCVCVCVYVYMCIYIYIFFQFVFITGYYMILNIIPCKTKVLISNFTAFCSICYKNKQKQKKKKTRNKSSTVYKYLHPLFPPFWTRKNGHYTLYSWAQAGENWTAPEAHHMPTFFSVGQLLNSMPLALILSFISS